MTVTDVDTDKLMAFVFRAVDEVGAAALGTQAGPARIKQVTTDAGFGSFRTVAETTFYLVYEVKA